MGFHVCPFCSKATSSGDVLMTFTDGRSYQMPDMILHYVAVHGWEVPYEFYERVLAVPLETDPQNLGWAGSTHIGYLTEEDEKDCDPRTAYDTFFRLLWVKMEEAKAMGRRKQTRG